MISYKMPFTILVADDDEEDRMLVKEALEESPIRKEVNFVENGEELLDYLHHQKAFEDKDKFRLPSLILLDLNMPKKDGREALKEIKADEFLRCIPVIVFTTTKAEEDIIKTYRLGVSSFIAKPVSFATLVEEMQLLCKHYFEVAELPEPK